MTVPAGPTRLNKPSAPAGSAGLKKTSGQLRATGVAIPNKSVSTDLKSRAVQVGHIQDVKITDQNAQVFYG
jgi:hypothetical protein